MTGAQITAAILAGGQSRRMGRPKALLPWRGKSLVQHLIDTLSPQVAEVVIAGTPEPALYDALACTVLPDTQADSGPLSGVLAALQHSKTPLLLCVPCDGIVLPPDFIESLVSAMESSGADLVYAKDSQREQQLFVLLKCSLQGSLRDYLEQDGRKVIAWYQSQHYAVADFSANGFVFANLNDPDDWQQFISINP